MGKKRNKVEIFKLEDRVLFEAGAVVQAAEAAAADQANNDAAGDGSAAAEMQSDNNQTASNELTPDNLAEMPVPPEMSGSDNADDTADADAADFAAADPESETVAFTDAPIAVSETSERILVVLNSSVADADSIVNDLGDNVEVLRLTSGTDALDTINDYLDEHADTKYSAIHLVSHGSEGYITLNGEKIDSTTINPADWKAIGEHLTDDADILVYGCDTAKSEEGKALVQTIANLTGADVAASIDSTGAAGDWDLEYRSGLIEAATINPVSYQHDLAASTFIVDGVGTDADDTDSTYYFTNLSSAITKANELGGEIEIKFSVAANTDTNADGQADAYIEAISSTLDINTSGLNLTINGWSDFDSDGVMDSGEQVILDGGMTGTSTADYAGTRIMSIGSDSTVTLQNLTLQNGFVSGGNGGAILNSGNLTLQSVSLLNNANMSDTAITWGGAVYNSGTLVVEDSLFSGNATYKKNSAFAHGAAISNKGTLTISGTTFDGNVSAQDAGAIYNENGKLTITDSKFLNNKAASNGSAIYVLNGSLDVSDSSFSGNTGNNVIYNGGKPVTIDSSVFTGNGGTVLVNYTGTMYVLNSTFLNNTGNVAIKGQGSANVGSSYTVVLNSTIIGQTGIGVQGYAAGGTVFIGNSIIAGSTQNDIVSQGAPVAVVGSIYDKTSVNTEANANLKDLGGNYVISEHLADGETVYQHLFDTDTPALNGVNVLMPTLEKAVSGGIVFRVEPDANSVNMLQYNDGTGWKNVQKYSGVTDGNFVWEDQTAATLLTQAQVSVDQVGNSRLNKATYSVGAVDLQSLIVTTTEDVIDAADGKTSLREAIANAVNLGGGTITFATDVNWDANAAIRLSSSIAISEDLAGTITIDGSLGGDARINVVNEAGKDIYLFKLEDTDTTTESSFVFRNIKFDGLVLNQQSGKAGVFSGRGINVEFVNMELSNSTITANLLFYGNSGDVGFFWFGGVDREIKFTDSVIRDNTVTTARTSMGATYITTGNAKSDNLQLVFDNLHFNNNKMIVTGNQNTASYVAHMILSYAGSLTVKESEFTDNAITLADGANVNLGTLLRTELYVPDCTITDSLFRNNSSFSTVLSLYKANLYGTDFIGNKTTSTANDTPGPISIYYDGYAAFCVVNDCLFEDNYFAGNGGTLTGGSLIVTNSAFINNSADGNGGALYLKQNRGTSISNTTFYGNSAGGYGGAISTTGTASVLLSGVTMAGNYAAAGGGAIYAGNTETAVVGIGNSIILGNTSGGTKDATTGVVTGAIHDDIVIFQSAEADAGNLLYAAGRSVIGTVTHIGLLNGTADGTVLRNPLIDLEGNVIALVRNVEYTTGSSDLTATYKAGNEIAHSTWTVDNLFSAIFGTSIKMNTDGRTVRTYLAEGLNTNGVEVTTSLGSGYYNGGIWLTYQLEDGKYAYIGVNDFRNGPPSYGVDSASAKTSGNYTYTATNDQMGKSREFTILKDSVATTYYAKGASSGLLINPLVVETLDDTIDPYDYKTSLREAIIYANQEGGDQTITFSTATDWLGTGSFGSGATITLAPEFGALEIKSNITIESKLDFGTVDQGYVTISGGDATQIFTIAADAGLTLSNITLTNGFAADTNGGAIYNAGTLTMTASTVSNSKVVARSSGVGVNGGAIYNALGATLTLTNTDFTSNSSVKELDSAGLAKGGAIHNAGTMTITGGVFDGNSAQIDGGAINAGPSATISGVTIRNTLSSNGIYVNNGTVVITDSTFTGNAENNIVQAAGGANVLIEGSLFTGNSVCNVSNSDSTVTIVNSVFVGNTIGGNKGIITTSQGGKTLILNSTVAGNTGDGHGIYAMTSSSQVDIYNSVITDRIKILDSTPVNLYSTVYALTDGDGLTADTNSIQVVASDADGSVLMQVFGKDTVTAETALLPKLENALYGGLQFKVDAGNLQYHNGTEWLTIQPDTLVTDAQAGSDYAGADRRGVEGVYTMGAYDGTGLIVTTNSDNAEDGNTLREAIEFAVSIGGGEITFAAGKDWESMGTITLSTSIAVSADLAGDIVIDGSYTKADGSAGRINIVNGYTLNAKGQKVYQNIYLFNVKDTATATASSFTLKNLTFDGLNYTTVAGVVAGTGLTLNVDHVAISNAVVNSTNIFVGNGNATVGFVYIQSGTLNLTDSVFENNTFTLQQTMSSGVLVTAHKSSTVLMENVKFLDNSMTGTRKLADAGTMMVFIADTSPSVTLRDVEFSGNKALVTDAAKVQVGVSFLDVRTHVVTVERMTAENNTSYNSAFYFAGSGTLRDSTFRNNTVTSGSTIKTAAYSTSYLKIINTLFEGNSSGTNGGAVSGGHLDITDSAFINNTATGNGGALAISIVGASNVKNSTFFGNSAANGGAIYLYSGVSTTAVFTLTNLTIAGNTATGHGGGIYAWDSSTSDTASSFNVMIGNSIILGNKAGADQHAEDYAFRADNQVPTNKLTAAANSIIGAVAHVGVDGQTTVRNPLVNAYDTSIIVQARNVALNDTQDGYIYSADNILTLDTEHTIDNLITTIFGSRIRLNADGRSVRTFAVEGLTLAGERTAFYHHSGNSEFNKASGATLYVRDTANDTWIMMNDGKLSKNANVATTTTATSGNVEITKDQYGLDRTFEILWPDANGVLVNTTFTAMGATTTFTIDPLTVTTLDDVMDITDGKTSLREAIIYANQEGGDQTITFSNATDWLGTGTFGSGAELTLDPALGAMNVTANITIDGALVYGNGIDQGTLTITGGDAVQIFTIAAGSGMTISNMSLTGGNAGEGNGGAINNAGTLALNKVNVSNSKAMNGGAIYSTGSLTVNGGTFYGNSVDGSDNLTGNGGAIHSTGTATISNAVFDSNSAKYNGGAIYNGGTLTIAGSVFSGHSAQNGVVFNQGNLLISGGTYTGNTANVLGTWGGTALIANAEIFGNTAADTININGDGSVIIIGSTIADNDDTNVINAVSGSANVYNSILEGATAGTVNLYSSVYTSSSATADANSILVTESAEAGSVLKQIFGKEELSMSGGLLPVLDKALTGGIQFQVDGSDNLQYHNGTEWITIQANTLLTDAEAGQDITGANRRGAGLYTMGAYDASGLIVTTSADTVDPDDGKNSLREAIAYAVSLGGGTITFSKNVDWTTQGTITLESTLTISGDLAGAITIDGSYTKADGSAGRIILTKVGTTNYRLFTVTDSNADTGFVFTMRNFAIKDVTLAKHSSATQGAVIYSSKADILLDNLVVDNVKINNSGDKPNGGLFRIESADLTILNSKVSNTNFIAGSGPTNGGVLCVNSGKLKISGSEFINNRFSSGGNSSDGGVIYTANSTVEISGSTFSGNSIVQTNTNSYGRGGAAYFDKSTVTIKDSRFIDNSSLKEGGAIYSSNGTLTVSGSHFEGNISARNGGAIARNLYFKIDSSSFVNNRAGFKVSYDTEGKPVYTESGSYSGGAIYLGGVGGFVPITNSTFYGNKATNAGGAIYINAGNHAGMVFSNLTVAGNHANKTAGGIYIAESATNQFHIANSLVLGNTVNTYEVDAEGTSKVTGTTYYDFGFYQDATNTNRHVSASYTVFGVVKHAGATSLTTVRNPLKNVGGVIFGELHNVTLTDNNITSTNGTYSAGTVLYNSNLYADSGIADNKIVDTMVKSVFGSKISLNADGKTVHTYAVKDLTMNGVLTAYNSTAAMNTNPDYILVYYDEINQKWVYGRDSDKTATSNPWPAGLLETDQLGNNRKVSLDGGQTYFYVKGATAGLDGNVESLVVDTLEDVVDPFDFKVSLREAVQYANANGGGTITFSDQIDWSATDKTITLDAKDAKGNLLGALAVKSNITIDGSLMYGTVDCGTITIDGNDAVQLFTIASGVAADFRNMTFANGFVSGKGGAVYNEGTLSLTNTAFRENTAGPIETDFIGNGGAIYNNGGTLTIADSRFENNLADGTKASHHGGGALYVNNGTVTIRNTIFTGNSGHTGGAIEIEGHSCNVVIHDSVFSNNVSRMWEFWGSGGAINIGSGSATLTVTGSLFDGNRVAGGGNYGINGGAIAIREFAKAFIDSSTFVNQSNGVFVVRGTNRTAHMMITNSTIINNSASGGIFFQESSNSFTVINSLIGNNTGLDFFSPGADNGTYSQLHHVITTGTGRTWSGTPATLGGASLTVLSAADFKALFADGSFDADGKVVLTADGTVAISKDSAAAYAGALVGKLDGAYYYAVDGYWYSLDGTKGNALTSDAATGYGLGDTATIYTTAQNTDTNGDPVSRVLTTLAFNAGAHALGTVETPSLVVNAALDAFNPFDGKSTLREAIAEAQRNGGTVTFDQAAIAASGARTVTVGSDTYYVIDILKTANSTNNGSAFILTNNLAIDGGTNKIMLDISKSNGTSMQVGRYFEVGKKTLSLTIRNLVIRGSGSDADGNLDLSDATKRNVTGAFYYGGPNMNSDYVFDHVTLERFNTSGKGVIDLHAWHKTYNFIDSTIQDNASATYLIRLQSSNYAAKFQGVTIQRNTTGTLYEGTMSINFSTNAGGDRNLFKDNTFSGSMFTAYISVSDTDIMGNTASGIAAGFNKNSFTLKDSTVTDNTFSGTLLGAKGSARWGHYGTVTVENTVFTGNTFNGKLFEITRDTQDGYESRFGVANMNNVTFANNTMTATSPLLNSSGEFTINNLTFYNNTVAGDLFSVNGGTLTLTNSTIAGNTSATAAKIHVVNVLSGTVTLLNNILVGNNGTNGTSAVTVADGATVNAFYNVYDSADATLNSTNTVGTMADVLGTTPAFDGKTVAIAPAGAAAINGTLVGKIGSDLYYVADGSWFKVGSDTAAATFDAANTNNDNYGLGTATGTSVYTTAQNGMDRLAVADLGFFNVGAYAFDPAMVETASTVVDLAEDVVNPFDGKISLREAIAYAGTGSLGNEITFADAVTAVTLTQLLAVSKNITITDNDVTVNGNLSVASGSTLTVSSGSKVTLGTVSNSGTVDNKGTLTLAALEGAGNLTNSGTLDVNGDFAGGTVNNTGSMSLAGASNSGTGTLGNVTYDGADGQNMIAADTYGNLVISTTGTATVAGDIKATTTTVNSGATLDVNGDFAGGTLTNNGSLNLAGANNTATGTLGNVTYDGTTQQVIAGTYGNLTIGSTGTATANGDLTATTTTVNSGATLDVNGNFAGGTVTNSGSMILAGETNSGTGTLGDVTYDGTANQQIIASETYSDLVISTTGTATVNGNLKAETTTNSATLDVNGNFAGGAVNNTGSMTLAGASNSGTGTLGNVTYDGADQQVIAGTYGDLTINSTGTATANGDITATTTTNSSTLDVNGNFAGGTVTNTGSMSLAGETNSGTGTLGNVTYDGADQQVIAGTYGDLTINSTGKATATGNVVASGSLTNTAELTVDGNVAAASINISGDTEVTGNLTADSGDIESTAALTVGGNVVGGNITTSGETEVTGSIIATGDIESTGALTVGGSVEAYNNITTSGVTKITNNLTANSGDLKSTNELTVGGDVKAADITLSGKAEVTGDILATENLDSAAALTVGENAKAYGDIAIGAETEISGDMTAGDMIINWTDVNLSVGGSAEAQQLVNYGEMEVSGDVTLNSDIVAYAKLTAYGSMKVGGDVEVESVANFDALEIAGDLTATDNIYNAKKLTVGGDYSAASTNNGETLTVSGNFSGGAVNNSGSMTLSGASNTANAGSTLGDVTYNGTTDQEVIAGTYEDLVISTTGGTATASDAVTAATTTVSSGATLDAAGDLDAGALANSGSISVAGAFATTSTDLGAVEYDGTAAQNVVEGTYSDLSLTGGDKSLAGAVTVTDSLTADANIDTAGQDLTLSGDVAGSGTISATTDSGTVTYDGADQNVLAGAYNNLALANGTKTLNSTASTTVNDTFTANGTTIQSDAADVLASLTVKDAGNDSTPSSNIAGTTFNGIALNNTGSADGYLYVNADTNNADDATTGVYLVGNVFVTAEGIIYGDTLGEVCITVTNGNGDVICEGTADDLGWTWAVGNDAIENATTGTAYELVSKEGFKFRFHGDVDVVIGKRAITVKADDLEIDTGDDPVFTYTYVGELVGSDAFTGELASDGDGSKPGDFEITQGTLTLGDNYDITFIGGTLTVEGGGQDAHQFPNYNNPGNFAGVYDAPVHSTTHSYDHHESVPTLEHQNDRSIGFLFSVSNKQLGDASGAFGDSAPQGSSVNIHAHTLSDLLKSYNKSEQIIASPANEIEDAKDDMKDLHDFSNNSFGILPDDEDLHTRAYDESIDFTVIGEDNLSTAKAEQFKDEFDAALEELLTLA